MDTKSNYQKLETCLNCNNTFVGKYCNVCGQKAYTSHDKKVGSLLHDVFHFITHVEGNIATTLKYIFFKPGVFSKEFCEGKKKKFFKPVSMYLIIIVLYLIFPFFKGLNMNFSTYINQKYDYANYATPIVKGKLENKSYSIEQLGKQYDKTSEKLSKIYLILLIPLSALALKLLFWKKNLYFYDHSIYATEFSSFFVGLNFLIVPLVVFLVSRIFPSSLEFFDDSNAWFGTIIHIVVFYGIFAGLKTFYSQKWYYILIKSFVFYLSFLLIIDLYKLLLFISVMAVI